MIEFPWGVAVKNLETDEWLDIFLDEENHLDVSNKEVILHQNGIEFL